MNRLRLPTRLSRGLLRWLGRPADPSLLVTLGRARRNLVQKPAEWLAPVWPGRVDNPVFVVGCARSGTTILGELLGRVPGWRYLNEPAYLWCALDPALDIWEFRYPITGGQLVWGPAHAQPRQAARLAQRLHLEQAWGRRVVEKTPENVFRVGWLAALLPRAQFVHIIRHGRDTALSLAKALPQWLRPGYWEASDHYAMYRDYAASSPALAASLAHLDDEPDLYRRCLLVWLCALHTGRQAGQALGPGRYYELHYEALVGQPAAALERLFAFLGEPLAPAVTRYAARALHAGSVARVDPQPAATEAIAGAMLRELGYSSHA